MYLSDYQREAKQYAVYEDELYPFLGLAEEAGEFVGLMAKGVRGDDMLARFGGDAEKLIEAYMKEAGDVLWMLTACLQELGLELEDVAKLNLQKLADRKARDVLKGSGDER